MQGAIGKIFLIAEFGIKKENPNEKHLVTFDSELRRLWNEKRGGSLQSALSCFLLFGNKNFIFLSDI